MKNFFKKLSLNDKIFYGLTILSIGLWIIVSFGALLACLIVGLKSGMAGLKDFLSFIDFGDFFDVLNFIRNRSPYLDVANETALANYPPLAYMILYPFSLLAGADGNVGLFSGPRAFFSLALFFVICLTFISILVYKLFKVEEKRKRILFIVFAMFSFPVLYLLLRANILLVALIFILFFVNYYKSENRLLRELALVALAFAVAIKIYPVFFAILLIREKRFLDCLKSAFYSLILFFIPFLVFKGGFDNVRIFIDNLIGFTNYSGSRQRDISIGNAVRIVFDIFNIEKYEQAYKITALVLTIIITGSSIVASFFLKKPWKVFLLIALMCITAPLVSFSYSLVFLIPGIAFFFKEEKELKDIFFAVLFLILFSATGFFIFINSFIVIAIQVVLIFQAFQIKKVFLWARGLDRKLKFLFVGGLNTALGMGVYLVILLAFGLNLNESNSDKFLIKGFATIISTIVGVINSYFWNKYFTFESREKTFIEKVKFVIVYAVTTSMDLGLKAALSYVKVLNEYLISLICIIIIIITSYLGQRFFVFRKAVAENERLSVKEPNEKFAIKNSQEEKLTDGNDQIKKEEIQIN